MKLAIALLTLVGILIGLFAENITLVALEDLNVYDAPDGSVLQSSTGTTAVVRTGDRLLVTGCVDQKHYMVPKVLLQDGRVGYLLEGTFNLERTPFLKSFGWPIVFSC